MDEDTKREFERRKWLFLRKVADAYKRLKEERAKPATKQLGPPSYLDAWEEYLGTIKSTCEKAQTQTDLPPKIDRVSKLDEHIRKHWPIGSDLGEKLLAIEERWSVFR